jgi:hypothetical protein
MAIEETYRDFLARAAADANVVGVVLSGSRGAGALVTDASDFDVFVLVREATDAWPFVYGAEIEAVTLTLDRFETYAMPGDVAAWNRPAFLFARVEIDTLDGEIERLLEQKRRLTPDEAAKIAGDALDDYINSLYRSLRNLEAGRDLEGRLDAADTIPALLTVAFALDGRVRPFNKWLRHALAREALSFGDVAEDADRMHRDPTPAVQREVFRRVEAHARARGHDAAIDSWQPNVAWLRGEDPA